MRDQKLLDRRGFIRACGQLVATVVAVGILGCERSYKRPGMLHDLGPIEELLYSEQFIRDRSLLLRRDGAGWSVMSARCTHDGCNLSYQDQVLTCVCCGSMFSHEGFVVRGPATTSLPYYELSVDDDHLIADANFEVPPTTRFSTPEIEQALQRVQEKLRTSAVRPGTEVPEVLLGKGSDNPDQILKEKRDETVPSLSDIQPTPSPTLEIGGAPSLLEKLKRDLMQKRALENK